MHLIDHDNALVSTAANPGGGDLWTTDIDTPLGVFAAGVLETAAGIGLALLEFGHGPRRARGVDAIGAATGAEHRIGSHPMHAAVHEQLTAYANGSLQGFDLSVHLIGTVFQRRVWRTLLEIPYGAATTYHNLAESVGTPGGSRAVGGANGSNRVAVVIPCHRVIASGGTLGGYAGGLDRKERLLTLEGVEMVGGRVVTKDTPVPMLWSP